MYVWGVSSTVTKHSDSFVWKDTSERVTRRCDDTVDKKHVNSCVLKHLLPGSWATKNIAKKTWKCSLWRATKVKFSWFCGWRRNKKLRSARFSETVLRAVLINPLIRIDSRPKILRSYYLNCTGTWHRSAFLIPILSYATWRCYSFPAAASLVQNVLWNHFWVGSFFWGSKITMFMFNGEQLLSLGSNNHQIYR